MYENISALAAVALAQDEDGGDLDADEVMSDKERRKHKIE